MLNLYIQAVDGLTVAARCENALQAFQVLQQQPIDLMFLDITMPQLLGTDFLRTLRNPPPVIITTAHRDYALDGYELDVLDYLLKPIPFERFLRAVGKALKLADKTALSIPAPITGLASSEPMPGAGHDSFLYFRVERKLVKVLIHEILYIESLKDYLKIALTSGKPLIVKHTISALEAMLPTGQFMRTHRSFIVATDKVMTYTPRQIEVSGREIPIGRLYQQAVERALRVA